MQKSRRLRIGYALEQKRVKSFIAPSLLNYAKDQGIDLVQIDVQKPLIEQGPFDLIVHKFYDEGWKQELIEFSSRNPNVVVIDSPDAIERLHDRISMLEVVSELEISKENESQLSIPNQVYIYDSKLLADLNAFKGFKFPVLAKPFVANGPADSHKLSLVFNNNGLKELEPPVILQEFVNHGGVIFKVYAVGKYVKCVKRNSLPDISDEKLGTLGDSMWFSKISNLDDGEEDEDDHIEEAEMPPLSFVTEIANGLRRELGMNLFNFDIIRDAVVRSRYLIVDINYFPAYEKLPDYESILTDFFWDIVDENPVVAVEESCPDSLVNI